MVAGLLYIIGLISILVSLALVGYSAPPLIEAYSSAMAVPDANVVMVLTGLVPHLSWVVTPVVGGLILMGLGRVISLLSAINRALRGTP